MGGALVEESRETLATPFVTVSSALPTADLPCPADDDAVDLSASAVLDLVMTMPAGPAAVGLLAGITTESLDSFDRVLLVRAWQRQTAFCEGMMLTAVSGVIADAADRWSASDEVAAAARISRPAADRKVSLCRRLTAALPATAAALARGDIGYPHILAVHDETLGLSPRLAHDVEQRALRRATQQTPGQLRSAVRKLVAVADPIGFAERHRRHADAHNVTLDHLGDGVTQLYSTMTTPDAATVKTAVDAWADAHRTQLPGLNIGQRRVAALVSWARHYLTDPTAPLRHGHAPNIDIVIDLPTLLGLAEHAADVPGYGEIPADLARRLAADGSWRRLVTDPTTGHLLDCGRRRYQPSAALRDFLLARERVSSFPGATTPAERCDLDHTEPYQAGGRTDRDNLGPVDRRAHRAKTLFGWALRREPGGATTWTSPTGHRYDNEPHDYRLGP
jgi:hypothetical protein